MTLSEFFNSEIEIIVREQINFSLPQTTNEDLSDLLERIFVEEHFFNISEVREFIGEHEFLHMMMDLIFIFDRWIDFVDSDMTHYGLYQINEKLRNNPESKLLCFLWLIHRIQLLSDEEFDLEIAFILNDTLIDYPYLVRLTNFFENSFFPALSEKRIKSYPKLLQPVFEKSVELYRGKIVLYYHLALCYLYGGLRDKAFSIFRYISKRLLDWNQEYSDINEDYFTFRKYAFLVIEIIKDLENIAAFEKIKVMISDVILVYFTQYRKKDDVDDDETRFFIECFFLRMRSNLKKNNLMEVRKDYYEIEPYLQRLKFKFWKTKYADVLSVLSELAA